MSKLSKTNLSKTDNQGNTILHQFVREALTQDIPLDLVQTIVQASPALLTIPNKQGLIPAQLLESLQNHIQSANRPFRRLLIDGLPESPLKEKLRRMTEITLTEHIPASQNDGIDFRSVPTHLAPTLLQKPTLLCFSGRGTFDPAMVTGFMRKIRASLNTTDVPFKNAQILCARYPGHMIDLTNDWYLTRKPVSEQISSDHPSLYTKPFVHRYFRPLYLDSTGHRLPIRQAAHNMRLLTFFGYSYGTTIIQLIADELSADMGRYGYTPLESALIQSQVLSFQMGPDLNPDHYQNHFRQYHLLNTQDEIVFDRVSTLLPPIPVRASDLILTHLKDSPNQTVLLVDTIYLNNDDTPHHTNTYCNDSTPAQKRVKLWKNSILFNSLNNSVQNLQSLRLIPLPKNIETPPKRLLFTKTQAPLNVLTKSQKTICQQQKITVQSAFNCSSHQRN